MEYAVFRTGGKQYKVSKGDVLDVDRITGEENKNVSFDDILLYVSESDLKLGKPSVAGYKVLAKILKQKKGDKVRVEKFKAKSRYRRTAGFRAHLTEIIVESIVKGDKKEKSSKSAKEKKG